MKDIIDYYRKVVVQIATPYSTGTGFLLKDFDLVITNEHVVRDNKEVIIDGSNFEKQLARVIYTDQKYDLAFIEAPELSDMPEVHLDTARKITEGDPVIAVGHPFGLKYTATQGIVSNTAHIQNEINYIQHDAALNPGNSGGPLINNRGEVVGINTFIIREGDNIGFSLPANYLDDTLKAFTLEGGKVGTRCYSCGKLVFEHTADGDYCPNCGSKIHLPSKVEAYEPAGISKTIEDMLGDLGYDVRLSRRGPNNWELQKGSAKINISYYEKNGLITGDAFLCLLPQENIKPLYEYLLRQNYKIEGLTFSVKGQDIILSLLIYDRYLNSETGLRLFRHLFDKADYYDNILIEQFGAQWKQED
ncbi:MAG TPA: trypsin-like peptidase domain-containing protein [Saprospiraceae bacterium]|nr:trypsin-like peptidase domain-containing protein [Saprospiraceae bacterium]